MPLPQKNNEYGTKQYWDSRYSQEDPDSSFDWFKSYADLAAHMHLLIPNKMARILMLGCGNSRFSEDLWEDGYRNIVNIDYSAVIIKHMRARHAELRPGMEWHEMDVRALSFEDASFDIAIDKGGVVLRAVLPRFGVNMPACQRNYGCDDDIVHRCLGLCIPRDVLHIRLRECQDPPDDVIRDCTAEVSEVLRVLRPSGAFLYITFGQPHFRRRFLTGSHVPGTRLEVKELGESFHYYMYIMRKVA